MGGGSINQGGGKPQIRKTALLPFVLEASGVSPSRDLSLVAASTFGNCLASSTMVDEQATDAASTEQPKSARGGEGADDEGDAGTKPVRVSKFMVRQTGRTCNAVFIPKTKRLGPEKLMEIVRDEWKVTDNEMPDILICCDAGTVHPRLFATDKLLEQDTFREYKENAERHAEIANQENREEFALKVIVRRRPCHYAFLPQRPS